MTDPKDVVYRYRLRTALFIGGYAAVNIAAISGAFDDVHGRGAWALALVIAAPITGYIWAFLAYLRDSDEFIRGIMAKRFIVGTGIALAFLSAWGLAECYARAPHFPTLLALPLVWLTFALVTPFIRTSH